MDPLSDQRAMMDFIQQTDVTLPSSAQCKGWWVMKISIVKANELEWMNFEARMRKVIGKTIEPVVKQG